MPFPVFLLAAATAVTDLLILAGGSVVASMTSEPPESPCSVSENAPEDSDAPLERPGDAHSVQDLDETQVSSSVITNLESVPPCDSTCSTTTTTILDETSNIPTPAIDDETLIPNDQPMCTSTLKEQPSISSVPEVTARFPQPSTEQGPTRVFPRKRRASSITSSVESLTSHEPPSPREVRWSDMVIASSAIVASGSQLPSHVTKPSGLIHDDTEEPASKKRHEEATPRPWVKKFVHSTRHKLSDLRPCNYSRRFRKQIRPALHRKESNISILE